MKNSEHERLLPDRKLGHEWADWDGDLDRHQADATAPPALFLSCLFYLALSWGLLLGVAGAVFWSLPTAQSVLGIGAGILLLVFMVLPITSWGAVFFPWRRGRPLPGTARLMALSLLLLPLLTPWARLMGKSRDQLLNSYLQIRNSLTKSVERAGPPPPGPPLILAPRCMTKESMQALMRSAQEHGAEFFIATTGAKARAKVTELRPSAIVAVACERDLVSGIRDVAGREIPVITLPITLPAGPCKSALVDLDELADALTWIKSAASRKDGGASDGCGGAGESGNVVGNERANSSAAED